MRGGVEGTEDVRVHHDGHVALRHQVSVTGLHASLHPLGEGPTDERVRDVDDPLPRKLANVVLVGEVEERLGKLARLGEKLFDAEALVLRHGQVLDSVRVQELLASLDERFQEIDRHLVVRGQVRMTLYCREVVPIDTVRLQIDTYTSRLERYLDANIAAVIVCTARSLAAISIQVFLLIINQSKVSSD